MWKYIFSGVVTPERAPLKLYAPVVCEFNHSEAKIQGTTRIEIYSNQIILTFTAKEQVSDIYTLKNLMTDLVSGTIECAGLIWVVGYDVDLRSMHAVQEQNTIVFGIDIPGLSPTWEKPEQIDINSIFFTGGKNIFFRHALSDFKNGIRHPADTGFFCYRAIESLTHHFNPNLDKNKKPEAIDKLNQELNLDSGCLEKLRALGGDVRHGKPVWVSNEDRILALKLTREIILRFYTYIEVTLNSKKLSKFEKLII